MIFKKIKNWLHETSAVAAIESMLIFPVIMTMFFGIVDIGTGIIINTKVISASQISSDLLARNSAVTDSDINEARLAAEAAMIPYFESENFGLDIVGIRFDGEEAVATEQWRDTFNMSPNLNAVPNSEGLGSEDEGLIVVTVEYHYSPRFSNFLTGEIEMREVAYVKGRNTPYVERQ